MKSTFFLSLLGLSQAYSGPLLRDIATVKMGAGITNEMKQKQKGLIRANPKQK
tara:strand:- start:402 stop:560 length:159 start_codon:yes stop_codon:yes gene_type:complete